MTTGNSVHYEGLTIPYDITFSPRRKSIAILVHHTKRVEIKAPTGTSASFIHDLTMKKVTWIVKRLIVLDSMNALHTERKYHEGEVFFSSVPRLRCPLTPTRSSTEGSARMKGILL
ncbi:MAG: hypothetical protein WCJ93_07180 [Methanomicrobiales archaeon]